MEPGGGKSRKKAVSLEGQLSLGGRMTPMRSVLSNLLVYYMPIFKCSILVVNQIEKLQQDFFVVAEIQKRSFIC